MRAFEIAILPPGRSMDLQLLIAAGKAGELGIIRASSSSETIRSQLRLLKEQLGSRFGIQVTARTLDATASALDAAGVHADLVLLSGEWNDEALAAAVKQLRRHSARVLREVISEEEARAAVAAGVDGLVAKGNEAGGRVGCETLFVLLQRLADISLPVWAFGGIGPHATAACRTAGAQGIVLQDEVTLVEESWTPEPLRSRLAVMDGTETLCLGETLNCRYRTHRQEGMEWIRELQQIEFSGAPRDAFLRRLDEITDDPANAGLYPVGQGIAFAGKLAARHRNLAGVLRAYRSQSADNLHYAASRSVVAENSDFAQAHGIRFPILQGPMTRVSDVAGFANSVSKGGGLPFLALALLREKECERLISETAALLGDRSWGVGILAFVPADLRAEQLKVVLQARPKFAILAGGRPEQANTLEAAGIRTYIHTPSAQLLEMFLRQGARRFIFEGRECGGHVGPLSSFVLWESIMDVLLEFQRKNTAKETVDVVFAGGIHDGRSAAMVSALSAAASAAGIRVGVLMGTAYLFTREAVETQAIVSGFQEEAVRCGETVLLEMGGGHAIRVAPSAYTEEFKVMQRSLRAEGLSAEEARTKLEDVNVGRLRIASKGLVREAAVSGSSTSHLSHVSEERQKADGLFMMGQVAALRKSLCSIEELHQSLCRDTSSFLRDSAGRDIRPQKASRKGPEPIAIVGMACHLPAASDLVEYWSNIVRRRDCIEEVPDDRWPSNLFFDTNPKAPDRSMSKWGGFMPPIRFDPLTYGIPPASLSSIEPVHLMLLEVTRKALADAGYDKRPFARESTAVILGLGGGTWDLGQAYLTRCVMELELNRVPGIDPALREGLMNHIRRTLPELTEDSFPGILGNVAAGRLANRFNLGGPNYTVDAACACSLAALQAGMQELWHGTSDVALVGAAEAGQNIFTFLLFSKTGALSPRGRCRPFDATADGIATSDGIGMLVLKRLSDAERDGDRIYSVIRSIGSASDGKAKSLTAPAVQGQTRALNRAYAPLEFSPKSVELVEAHGTGTAVGDRTELETLRTAFQADGARSQSCALGSVKSQIGHTKGTAGLASLLKVSMALHHRVLPPTLADDAAPVLRDRSIPLYLNTRPRPWFHADENPRRAAVSAFGFGGTNFHAVLEEYGDHAATLTERPAELFVFRGPGRAELAAELRALDLHLAEFNQIHLMELADALRREAAKHRGACRLAIVAKDLQGLRALLAPAAAKLEKNERFSPLEPVFFGEEPVQGSVAFLFPGQGSQYLNMLDELALCFPEAREVFERADNALQGVLPSKLTDVVFPPPAYSPAEEAEKSKALNQTWFAQPALGAADYAMYSLLKSLGIEPDAAAGHSYGEYAALCAAGSISFSDLIRISEQRGRVVQDTQGTDSVLMVAVQADAKTVGGLLANLPGVSIAGANAPNQTIVGGKRAPMESFLTALDGSRISYSKLAMSAGFHIPEAQPAADQFAVPLAGVEFRAPRIPVYSNLKASPYPADAHSIRSILVDQLTQPLRFQEEVEAMYSAGVRVFVEVGPGQVLSGLVQRILGDRPATILTTNRKGSDSGLADYLKVVGWFYAAGKPVRLERLFAANNRQIPELATLLKGEDLPKPTEWIVTGGHAKPMVEKKEIPMAAPVAAQAMAAAASNGGETAAKPAYRAQVETAYAAPAVAPVQSQAPVAPKPASYSNGTHASNGAPAVQVQYVSAPPVVAAAPGPVQPAVASGQVAEVVNAFQSTMQQFLDYQMESNRQRQELMSRFLDTQRAMVEVFARGGSAAAPMSPMAAMPEPQYAPYTPPPMPAMMPQAAPPPPPPAPVVMAPEPPPVAAAPAMAAPVAPPPVAPAVAHAPAAAPKGPSLQDLLLDLISKRTGYPPDMLELDQNLEADLGIDSIKRAEIFGGLLENVGYSQTDQEREEYFLAISKLRTLREVLGWLKERADEREAPAAPAAVAAPVAVPTPAAAPAESKADHTVYESRPLRRFLVHCVEEPLSAGNRQQRADEVVLLTEDHSGRAREATAALSAIGVKAAVVRHGAECRIVSPGIYEADLSSREALSQVRTWVQQQYGPVTTICHFLPLDSNSNAADCLEVKSLNALAGVFGPDLRKAKGTLVAVTGMGGQFGLNGEPREFRPGSAAIPLVMKCLFAEWPEVTMKAIDVDPREGSDVLGHVLAESASDDWRIEVGYCNGRRYALKTYIEELNLAGNGQAPLDESSVVLVTGGARGITAEIALDMAARFRPTFVLAGRSALPKAEGPETVGLETPADLKKAIVERRRNQGQLITPNVVESEYQAILRGREIRSTLDRLHALGSRAEYHALDVRDSAAFESLIHSIYEKYGRIDGVVHGAGIVEDIMFDTKSPESFNRVFDTKVQPALVLARALRPDSLRFVFFLSSLAARYGYAGGTDYSSANEVLNRLARRLDREWKARVVAIGWGPWEGVGIATRYPPDLLRERGVVFHPISVGVQSFMDELIYGAKGAPEAYHYIPGAIQFPE